MSEDYEKLFVEPIINASRPATLASLTLTILKFGSNDPVILQIILTIAAIMFLLSSFFLFFYSIYSSRRILWIGASITFLLGLLCSITTSIIMLITI